MQIFAFLYTHKEIGLLIYEFNAMLCRAHTIQELIHGYLVPSLSVGESAGERQTRARQIQSVVEITV